MTQATLELTVPEGVWIGDVSRRHPETQIRILAALADDDAGVCLAEVTGPAADAVRAAIAASDAVVACETLRQTDRSALVQFETTAPVLLLPVQGSGVPLEMPFVIEDGTAEWVLTAPRHRLSELASQLDAFGISYRVREVHREVATDHLLTDRQAELVVAAVEQGYYDVPRTCTLTGLADHLGTAKSTVSETLHRAESKVLTAFTADLADGARHWVDR